MIKEKQILQGLESICIICFTVFFIDAEERLGALQEKKEKV